MFALVDNVAKLANQQNILLCLGVISLNKFKLGSENLCYRIVSGEMSLFCLKLDIGVDVSITTMYSSMAWLALLIEYVLLFSV